MGLAADWAPAEPGATRLKRPAFAAAREPMVELPARERWPLQPYQAARNPVAALVLASARVRACSRLWLFRQSPAASRYRPRPSRPSPRRTDAPRKTATAERAATDGQAPMP